MSEGTLAAIAGRLPTPDDTPGEPLRHLLVLDLSRCQHVYDSLLLPVAESCRGLAALSLSGSLFTTDDTLRHFGRHGTSLQRYAQSPKPTTVNKGP